jgi:hypothetical protein
VKPFVHDFLPKTELEDVIIDGKRFYDTPAGKYKSVTTIIGESSDKSWLDAWRSRVGAEEADAILRQAGRRGTAVHSLAEKYVLNDPDWAKGGMTFNVWTFKKIAPLLDKHVDRVYGIEYPLWSDTLRTAGRTDLPCVFSGINTIGDFKTARSRKDRDSIPGYFVQATAYALMMEERTGVKFPQVAVMIAEDEADVAKLYVERCRDWYSEVARIFIRERDPQSPPQSGNPPAA